MDHLALLALTLALLDLATDMLPCLSVDVLRDAPFLELIAKLSQSKKVKTKLVTCRWR